MSRCVVVGGAGINNYDRVKKMLREDDYYIFCDSGLRHIEALGVMPSLIVGDFDSYEKPDINVQTIVLPTVKDDTDTVYGVKEGIKRGYDEFLLLGCVGARLDHSLGNVYILMMLYEKGLKGVIVDDYSVMELVGDEILEIPDSFSYFSLIAINGAARAVTIENAKYNLTNAEIKPSYQYGVSNEVIKGENARVSVKDGILLAIKVF
ncbi:MAG: thiamine diphosphokinase [Lachnospiraceae bacterium]|nr:thiamine diphosphokinase [Lachnospiraceae bacterium]